MMEAMGEASARRATDVDVLRRVEEVPHGVHDEGDAEDHGGHQDAHDEDHVLSTLAAEQLVTTA